MMSGREVGEQLSRRAREAYLAGNMPVAKALAEEAMKKLASVWGSQELGEAELTHRLARRQIEHPNPSLLRKVWWRIDSGWSATFAGGVSLTD